MGYFDDPLHSTGALTTALGTHASAVQGVLTVLSCRYILRLILQLNRKFIAALVHRESKVLVFDFMVFLKRFKKEQRNIILYQNYYFLV